MTFEDAEMYFYYVEKSSEQIFACFGGKMIWGMTERLVLELNYLFCDKNFIGLDF